jgi:hypothetical protein
MFKRARLRCRQRGAGLIEVALAIVIGITLVSAAAMTVAKNRDRAQTLQLESEEKLVFSAADAYYRSSCRSGSIPSGVTMATLLAQGYLPRAPQDIWGASWSVTYLAAPRRAQVSASLASAPAAMIPWITGYARADAFSGSTVSWVHNIRIAYDATSASAMEFKGMYEASNC